MIVPPTGARADKAHLANERDVLAAEVGRLIARNERLDRKRPVRQALGFPPIG